MQLQVRITRLFSAGRRRLFFGVGVLALIPLWIYVIAPLLLRIPADFSYSADIISVDNFYDESLGDFKGEQYSKTDFTYEVIANEGFIRSIKNTFHVQTLDGKLIFKTEPVYGVHAVTGKHVAGKGDKDRSGHLFAPRNLKKGGEFEYWHVSNNAPSTMRFVGEEFLYGLKVYKYKKTDNEPFDQTEFMGFLPGVPEERGVKLASNIQMWVEPLSGHLVKLEDSSVDYFYFDMKTGERIHPYNQFINTYSERSIQEHANEARAERVEIIIVTYGIPALLMIIGMLFLLSRSRVFSPVKIQLRKHFSVVAVFVISMSISFAGFAILRADAQEHLEERFQSETANVTRHLESDLDNYIKVLLGARGLYDASEQVSRNEWHTYVNSLNLPVQFPGVQGMGFARIFLPEEKARVVDAMRKDGYPEFRVFPEGERSLYSAVIYVEPPNERNQGALGFDMLTEKTRQRAMSFARDRGTPTASGKVRLLRETETENQTGFILYVPVYKEGVIPESIEDRKDALYGYVYSPFRMNDLIESIFAGENRPVNFRIYDGLRAEGDRKMYEYRSASGEDTGAVLYRKIDTIYVAGHPWIIEYEGTNAFRASATETVLSWASLIGGVIFSCVFSLLILSITRTSEISRKTAMELEGRVKERTKELEDRNVKLAIAEKKSLEDVAALEVSKRALMNILEDIEEEKARSEASLREVQKLQLAIESSTDMVVITDVNGICLYCNPTTSLITGFAKEEIMGKKVGTKDLWGGRMEKEFYTYMWDVIKNQKKSYQGTIRNVRKNGEEYFASGVINPVFDAHGELQYFVASYRDISQEIAVDKAKTEFVSLASHQLKTPISTINWYTEMLLDGDVGKLNARQKEYVEFVSGASKSMGELVNSLLSVSRLEMGTITVEPEDVRIADVVKTVVGELKVLAVKRKIAVKTTIPTGAPVLHHDPKLLKMIVQNLLSNALKYSFEKGKVQMDITFSGKRMVLKVSDQGMGIPRASQSKMFTKLYRADNIQHTDVEGTGLGLYIVKSVIERMGGTIIFTSIENKGTTFTVTLPLIAPEQESNSHADQSAVTQQKASPARNKRK